MNQMADQIKTFADGMLPDVTWEKAASQKLDSADKWTMGCASMIRNMEAAISLAEPRIRKNPYDALKELADMRLWLAKCLWSCNMDNFKAPDPDWPEGAPGHDVLAPAKEHQ